MAPTLVLDGDGLVAAAGAAGGSRLRTALVTVLAGILDEGLEPQEAVDRPRVHPAGEVVHAEPGRRRGRARGARAGGPHGQALARAASLLRRRQRGYAERRRC